MAENPQTPNEPQWRTALKSLLFILLVPAVVAGLVPWRIAAGGSRGLGHPFLKPLAVPLWLSGAGVLLWTIWDFTFKGRGTPAPVDPPEELVVEGLYRYSRNPMYVGVLAALLGHVLWQQTLRMLAYAIYIGASFHAFVLFYEEPNLEKRFGQAYQRYRESVPRWL
jgi:protein-S-isoprenylcysteine O-methyltransferase Ste14